MERACDPRVGTPARSSRSDAGPAQVLTGLAMSSRRVPRHGYPVLWDGRRCGMVTSGAPSPTLGMPIAMAYLEPEVAGLAAGTPDVTRLAVDIRGRAEQARVVSLPFYRRPG